MSSYINPGDLVEVNGIQYLATSEDYTKRYGGLSGGEYANDWEVAGVVDIINPKNGSKSTVRLKHVKKLS